MRNGLVPVPGRLVVAAHFDDAVLSCWHAITGAGEGVEVTVVTVFAGEPPAGAVLGDWDRAAGATDPMGAWRVRRAEDDRVLTAAGARVVHLPFVDAPYRTGPVPRAALIEALTALVRDAAEVWIPAGIGGHPDHLLAGETGLLVSGGMHRYMYADLPYAAAGPGWSALLTAARRGAHDDESWRAQLDDAPSVPALAVPIVTELSPMEQADKRRAVLSYASQIQPMVGTFGAWFDDPSTAPFEMTWDPGPGPGPGRPVDALPGHPGAPRPVGSAAADRPAPAFLTVMVRTLGTRPEQLAAALHSLAGQSCPDFNVVLLHHIPDPVGTADSGWHAPALPEVLVDRTRIVTVLGGARGRPLNTGIELSTGSYLAVLDDDDVAFEDWVATFRVMAGRHPGAVLRSRVSSESFTEGGGWLREDGEWPESFDLIDHLQTNSSPACGLAYPRACFTELLLRFDESLPVVEDWDLLLQAGTLCGVASSPTITAAYRRWNRGDDSLAMHSHAEWEAAMRTVVGNADQRPLLLPPGSVTRLRGDHDSLAELRRRLSDTDDQHLQLITAHEEGLERLRVEGEDERRDLLAARQRELTALRERHAGQVAAAIAQNTRMFHESTSWRITAPVRALGGLRRRLAQHRDPPPSPDLPPCGAAPIRVPEADEHPPPGAALRPPPEPTVRTWPAAQFDELYRQHPDPWGYTTRWYEQRKYAVTLASLPRQRYRRAFEPGCSIGVLSEKLAARTDTLLAADFAAPALVHARHRLARYPHVDVRQLAVPAQWPDGTFDLIVISEMATYLSDNDLTALVQRTIDSLEPAGTLALVHFRPATGTPHTADHVHDRFRHHPQLTQHTTHQEQEFILDVFLRHQPP